MYFYSKIQFLGNLEVTVLVMKIFIILWNLSKNEFACKISVDYYGKNSRRSKSP